ncbi:MAG: succinate dehydrogenase cytochrome b subunit [Bacteroidales bacterium]|nr:succinate dehydrogenase cytochrome b subunit [Bacteroidales bacterium]
MSNIFTSSIGKKLMMALLGIFLVLFLLVHLGVNLLILMDSRQAFNVAAHFMAHNIVIKVFEIFLFGGFILHIFYGLILQVKNWLSRPIGYNKTNNSQTSFFSKFMIHTAVIIFIFLTIHMIDFYFKSKFTNAVEIVNYNGKEYHDLAALVLQKFKMPAFVIGYILSFVFMSFHLLHGFQSAFQTLGINHKVYTPIIKKIGIICTLIITVGFTIIPLYVYFFK